MQALVQLLILTAVLARAGTVIDRIAVIVGKHVIKSSDIERDLRLTEFLNREPLDLSTKKKREAAERLIDQQIIRTEIATGGYGRAGDAQADALFQQIRHQRFADSAPRMDAELKRYSLTENDLRAQLLWQLTVLDFLQERFQPEVSPSDEAVRQYYDSHIADVRRDYGSDISYEAAADKIREALEAKDVNRQFEDWISSARQRAHIEYREGAFP